VSNNIELKASALCSFLFLKDVMDKNTQYDLHLHNMPPQVLVYKLDGEDMAIRADREFTSRVQKTHPDLWSSALNGIFQSDDSVHGYVVVFGAPPEDSKDDSMIACVFSKTLSEGGCFLIELNSPMPVELDTSSHGLSFIEPIISASH